MNTLNGVGDLDAVDKLELDSFYHIAAAYDGAWQTLYVNGELSAYRPLTGNIRTTTLPFLMAQMLPDNTEYNFKGVLDEVKIFDYALTPEAAADLYAQSLTAAEQALGPRRALLLSPNPATDRLTVRFPKPLAGQGFLSVFDLNGRLVVGQPTDGAAALALDVAGWCPGVYTLVFRAERGVSTGRFVKF